jgi:uncharacterized damage-inducible protein DinB
MNADQAKLLVEQFTGLMESETAATVKVLGAVGGGDGDYKPDAKSRSAREIAAHIAVADTWFLQSIIDGKFEFNQEAAERAEGSLKTAADIVAFYQKNVPDRIKQLRALPADKLTREIDFFGAVKAPAVVFVGMANNHSVHHRGQLAGYLRAMGSKVPAIYGVSADENLMGGM